MSKLLAKLDLQPLASPQTIRDRWITLAKKLHPDKGGDPAKFAEMGEVYRAALKEAENTPCQECRGTGTVQTRARGSFTTSEQECPHCLGSKKQFS